MGGWVYLGKTEELSGVVAGGEGEGTGGEGGEAGVDAVVE